MPAKRVFFPALLILTCLTFINLFAQDAVNDPQTGGADSLQTAQNSHSHLVDYQGFLSSNQGEPLSGPVTIRFSIWDALENGVEMWSETQTVDVRSGYFTAQLGGVSLLPTLLFNGSGRWLELAIGGEILKPRKRVNSVAHSLHSNNAAQLNGLPAAAYYTKNIADDHSQNDIDASHLGGNAAGAYLTTSQTDNRYVRTGVPNSVTGDMIVDGTIQRQDIGFDIQGSAGGVSQVIAQNGLEGGGVGQVRIGLTSAYQSGMAYDNRFVKIGGANVVSSEMITDNSIGSIDIKDGSLQPADLGFTAGTINGVVPGVGLSGGGTMATVTLSLRSDYQSGTAYDGRFVVRNEQNVISSSMIRNNDITSADIKDGSILAQDLSFPAGDITSVQGINGLSGGNQSGDVLIGLEAKYLNGAAYDSRFVNINQSSSISSEMIQNYSIKQEDMAFTAGDVTGVTASNGITGGGNSGEVHLELSIPYQTGDAYTSLFVEEGQTDAITSQMIVDGHIQGGDIAAGVVTGEHLAPNLTVERNISNGAVITAKNQSINTNTSGVEGRGYQGVRGIGSDTGVYGEGVHYGVYAKASNSSNYALFVNGKAHCTSGEWGDLAEYVPSNENLQPGDVVVIDHLSENSIRRCTEANDTRVAGIVSTAPTITVGEETQGGGKFALALAGIVPCKVIASEPIRPGDLLTTSATPGYAQKAVQPYIGSIVGKALEGLPAGRGVIRVLLTLQ